jgi:hypothetical protein
MHARLLLTIRFERRTNFRGGGEGLEIEPMVRNLLVARYGGFAESSFYLELVKDTSSGTEGRRGPGHDCVRWRKCLVKQPRFRGRGRRGRSLRVFRRIECAEARS